MSLFKTQLTSLIFISVLLVYVKSESTFINLPKSQTILEGESTTFECEVKPVTELQKISWTHNGYQIQNTSRVYQNGSNLVIDESSRWTDIGDYSCILTSVISGARQSSPPAHLTIIWIESATVELMSDKIHQIVLRCHIIGYAGPNGVYKVEWYRNSEKLSIINNIELKRDLLVIYNPSVRDNGLYRCMASNAAGYVMSRLGFVLEVPQLAHNAYKVDVRNNIVELSRGKRGDIDQPSVQILNEGVQREIIINESEPLELHCRYIIGVQYRQTNALIQLVWRKDSKILRQTEIGQSGITTIEPAKDLMPLEISRIGLNRQNGSLSLNNVITSDEGLYACQILIDGNLAATSDPIDVKIIEQLRFVPQPTSKNLELGSLAKIHCKAQGNPTPQIKWVQNYNDALPLEVDDVNGTLTFRNVSMEHRGNYTCLATNSQGHINATVSVAVVIAPKFIVAPTGLIEVDEMNAIAIHCQAIGDPKPTIRWDKDLEYLNENNTDQMRFNFFENGTLEIRDIHLDDDGRYGCTIGSSAGLKREEVRLLVKSGDGNGDEIGDGFIITRAVLITMSVALAYIILVVGLMIWCRYRRRRGRLNEVNKDNAELGENGKVTENDPCLPNTNGENYRKKQANGHNPKGSGNEAQKSDDTACSTHSKNSKKSNLYDHLAITRTAITDLIQIGRGEFGDVFIGKIKACVLREIDDAIKDTSTEKYTDDIGDNVTAAPSQDTVEKRRSKTSMDDIEEIREENEDIKIASDTQKLVLVKALNKIKDESLCQEFKRQIEMFRGLSHKGVVRLYGLCREKDPHLMVLEHTDWGDLKQFLLATAGKVNTSNNSSAPPPLKIGQLLAVAYQVARGMDAIYRSRFIHKDLATRNCIISSDFVVKVSYPTLCKDKYSKEYFKHRNSLLPVRWLAPECLPEDEYTTKSDIYSFGVLVWEIFNQATKLPFEEFSNDEIIQRSQEGKLDWSSAITSAPDNLKEVLMSCFKFNPKERPSFSTICSTLSKAMLNGDKETKHKN